KNPYVCGKLDDATTRGDTIIIPPIAHLEIKRGFLCKPAPRQEVSYNIIIRNNPVSDLKLDTLECGAELYAELHKRKLTVEDKDLLIAAFCLVEDCTLVTNNIKHFQHMPYLKIEDWSDPDANN
ncbi:MAG: hypothetical protein LBS19_15060, partial [Clostridiales bacterium]|nr:hypothetical protein [Clostridiales bacterium]